MGRDGAGKPRIVKGEDDRPSARARTERTSDARDLRRIDSAEGLVEQEHAAAIDLGECAGDGDALALAA